MTVTLHTGDVFDVLPTLPSESVHCCVTSPPYWGLRDYGVAGQLGSEALHDCLGWATGNKCGECFICRMTSVFSEVRRVLRKDGTLWLNCGDSYAQSGMGGNPAESDFRKQAMNAGSLIKGRRPPKGLKPKDLCGIPWRIALSLQADGWYLRSDIPWLKRSAMPESVTDRPAKALEYMFLLTKSTKYYFDMEAVKQEASPATIDRDQYSRILENDGPQAVRHDHETKCNGKRNLRNADMWYQSMQEPWGMVGVGGEIVGLDVTPESYRQAHFATYPTKLVEPCLLAGTSEEGCCPDCGKPWVRVVEKKGGTTGKSWTDHANDAGAGMSQYKKGMAAAWNNGEYSVKTTGWRPQCTCGKPAVPCTVLDPFAGSGTTLAVAAYLNLNAVGIELNPEYANLARKRIASMERRLLA